MLSEGTNFPCQSGIVSVERAAVSMVTRHEEAAAVPEEKRSSRSCALTRWRLQYRDTDTELFGEFDIFCMGYL
ncbi:hypothetical protein MHYP_G00067250 [Metynnis hypsauchen]